MKRMDSIDFNNYGELQVKDLNDEDWNIIYEDWRRARRAEIELIQKYEDLANAIYGQDKAIDNLIDNFDSYCRENIYK